MEKVIMPKELTAENGAKALLMGEFSIPLPEWCDECNGNGCEICNGSGQITRRVNVPWITIKEIYAKAVAHFSQAVKDDYRAYRQVTKFTLWDRAEYFTDKPNLTLADLKAFFDRARELYSEEGRPIEVAARVEIIKMTDEEYAAIPTTSAAAKLFE